MSTIRIPGVLARIAWCYVAAAILTRAVAAGRHRNRSILMAAAALLAGYWFVLTAAPFPGGTPGDLTAAGNIGAWLDRTLFGRHVWRGGAFDPERLLSTIPAIGTALFGVLAGWLIRESSSPRAIVRGLQGGTEPFVALGRNATLLFVLSGLLAKTLIYVEWPDPAMSLGRWLYLSTFAPVAPPHLASLLYALANLLLLYALLAAFHRRRIYLTV